VWLHPIRFRKEATSRQKVVYYVCLDLAIPQSPPSRLVWQNSIAACSPPKAAGRRNRKTMATNRATCLFGQRNYLKIFEAIGHRSQIQSTQKILQPEALANFFRCGSDSASGSKSQGIAMQNLE